MTITQFIEKAIQGGWVRLNTWHNNPKTEVFVLGDIAGTKLGVHSDSLSIAQILLDPLAWQAVGKTEGWDKLEDGRKWESSRFGFMPVWQHHMRRMVDFLCEGKSLEAFIETL